MADELGPDKGFWPAIPTADQLQVAVTKAGTDIVDHAAVKFQPVLVLASSVSKLIDTVSSWIAMR